MIAVRLVGERSTLREQIFDRAPIRIGRAPENEFVLFESSVSRLHARIDQAPDGGLVLQDLGSRNGLRFGTERRESVPIAGRTRCRLGMVEIEIEALTSDDTIELPYAELLRFERRSGVAPMLLALLIGLLGFITGRVLSPALWSPWQKERLVTVAGGALAMLIVLPIASFVLLVVLRTAGRVVWLSDTMQAMAWIVWLWVLCLAIRVPAYYVLSPSDLGALSGLLVVIALVCTAVIAAGTRRPGPNLRFRAIWALAVILMVLGFVGVGTEKDRRSGKPTLDFDIQPPFFGMSGRSEDLEDYLGSLRTIGTQAANEAEQVRKRQDHE